MKAAIFNKYGLENLEIIDIPIPDVKDNYILIKIIKVGVILLIILVLAAFMA